MNWRNLGTYTCPIDSAPLRSGLLDDSYTCSLVGCAFKISETRLEEITKDMRRSRGKREIAAFEASLSELNNFDRAPMSEDYADEIKRL